MAKSNNMLPLAAGVAIVIVLLIAASLYLGKGPSAPTTTVYTTVPQGLTTQTISVLTTTIVKNQTVAVAPIYLNCNGYNYTLSKAASSYTGYCNWVVRGQTYMNLTVWAGSYSNVTVALIQQNVTSAPFNVSYSGVAPCGVKSFVNYVSPGNYKVIFGTGAASACTPAAPAVMRISH